MTDVVQQMNTRAKTMAELATGSLFFFKRPDEFQDKAMRKHVKAASMPLLTAVREQLAALETWNGEAISAVLENICETNESSNWVKSPSPSVSPSAARRVTPGIHETLEVLGRDETLARIDAFIPIATEVIEARAVKKG